MAITIHEIYRSIQGESTFAGEPCTFIRTTTCDLRCKWCDTEHAFFDGTSVDLDEIIARVEKLGIDLVEITGGEPLLHNEVPLLAEKLMSRGATVLVETGGHRDISILPEGAIRIMDLKCPASGESKSNDFENIDHLNKHDEVKFVIADRQDFDWAVEQIIEYDLEDRVSAVLLSPVFGQCSAEHLTTWLLESDIKARVQLQMHKYIWSPETKGV